MPLLVAWKFHDLWSLFEIQHFTKVQKNFNVSLNKAMRNNQLGVLAGDVAYKITTGSSLWIRFKKEELVSVGQNGNHSEKWETRIDDFRFTIENGKATERLDPEVQTLLITSVLKMHQTHTDSHFTLQFLTDQEIKFGHMTLTPLLNWSLPEGDKINWRHVIERYAIVSNVTNFRKTLERAFEQNVVSLIFYQDPQNWPKFLSKDYSASARIARKRGSK